MRECPYPERHSGSDQRRYDAEGDEDADWWVESAMTHSFHFWGRVNAYDGGVDQGKLHAWQSRHLQKPHRSSAPE